MLTPSPCEGSSIHLIRPKYLFNSNLNPMAQAHLAAIKVEVWHHLLP